MDLIKEFHSFLQSNGVKSLKDLSVDNRHNYQSLPEKVRTWFYEKFSIFMDESFKEYLDSTDYFYAPASKSYHSNHYIGLFYHSLVTYSCALVIVNEYKKFSKSLPFTDQELFLACMFHDLCKVNSYKVVNKKTGPCYEYTNKPLGHGHYSSYLLSQYYRLSENLYSAITYHMGPWDISNTMDKINSNYFNTMKSTNLLYNVLFLADNNAGLYEITVV